MRRLFIETVKQFILLVFIFILVRVLEYAWVCFKGTLDFSLSLFFSRSINLDIFFIFSWSALFLLIVLLVYTFHKPLAHQILKFSGFTLVIIHLLLTGYFLISHSILNSSVLEFSGGELFKIISHQFSFQSIVLLFIILIISSFSYVLITKKAQNITFGKILERVLVAIYVLVFCLVASNIKHLSKDIRYFNSNFEYLIGNSKETLFLKSFDTPTKSFNEYDVAKQTALFHSDYPELNFSNAQYPLIHDEPYDNVLGPYFIKDSTIKPNIVLLICESLSSSFSGKRYATPVSLTPYLDSLASHGLSWNNFLANAERSHGVLTNILSSLPSGIGQRGFVNMQLDLPKNKIYPSHLSILEPLKDNLYESSFYYGGWGYYDRTGYFLKEHHIDHFVSDENFDNQLYKKRTGTSWGYNDRDLYDMSLNLQQNIEKKTPFIDIYQTLSLHTPYNLISEEYESKEFVHKRIRQLGIHPDQLHFIPREILSSIFFSEDALKKFMKDLKSKEAYKNTIFIITGDHGIDYPISNEPLERYRVPLIIHSDLLVESACFNGYSSHIDIVPSILALLKDNYGLQLPKEKHWLGHGLDTSLTFRNAKKIPLAIHNDNLAQYITGDYIKYKDRILRFDSLLTTSQVTDQHILDSILTEYDTYRFINEYTCSKDRIWEVD